jgi:hypothetical protein
MAQIVQNKWLNYWICGLIFVLISAVVGIVINAILALPIIGWVIYIIVMPLVMGYLVDWVSDRWMD